MFHFDITTEDTRLIAHDSKTVPNTLDVFLIGGSDKGLTTHEIPAVAFCDLEKIVAGMICCHGDIPAESYPHLEKLLEGCPLECRPIP